jgi:hypothetical protein
MKKYVFKYLVLFLIAASAFAVLFSCEGRDSNNIPTGTVTTTIGAIPEITFSGSIDGVTGFYTESGTGPIPAASTGIIAINDSDPDLAISFTGTTAGIYTIEIGEAAFSCSDAEGNLYAAMQLFAHTSGTVTITEYGAVGENIAGSYSVTADAYSLGSPSGSTVLITGDFTVRRGNDM